jgi:hypothetical protein
MKTKEDNDARLSRAAVKAAKLFCAAVRKKLSPEALQEARQYDSLDDHCNTTAMMEDAIEKAGIPDTFKNQENWLSVWREARDLVREANWDESKIDDLARPPVYKVISLGHS